jgi:hypothetical protein
MRIRHSMTPVVDQVALRMITIVFILMNTLLKILSYCIDIF